MSSSRLSSKGQLVIPAELRRALKLRPGDKIELTLDAPSGPPDPIKPSFELYGMLLAEQGRLKEAAAQFEQSLARMPNRRASVQGLQRVTTKTSTSAQ